MTELTLLYVFLSVGFLLSPHMNNVFFLDLSGTYSDIHKFSLFIFSFNSALWFVSGVNDLYLLGYGQEWSFYAALHGSFLGWTFVGCLVFFLMVASWIDGVSYVKAIGVVGLSIITPLLIGLYAFKLKKTSSLSTKLAMLSFASIMLSMLFAVLNEFWIGFPRVVSGISVMLVTHGFLNAMIALPCLFLAILYEHAENSDEFHREDNVVFFDDLCVLCSGTVMFLIKIDRKKKLKYSSLSGEFAQSLESMRILNNNQSVIFLSQGSLYTRAEAVIHILICLGGLYRLLGWSLGLLPFVLLNFVYDYIARNRYRLFGKNEVCLTPTEDMKSLFLP